MKKLLFTCIAIFISTPLLALPLEVDIPSKNIKLSVEGVLTVNKSQPLNITFTDSNESITLTLESYESLRSVMDSIYNVTTNTELTAPIYISLPTSNIESIQDILQ